MCGQLWLVNQINLFTTSTILTALHLCCRHSLHAVFGTHGSKSEVAIGSQSLYVVQVSRDTVPSTVGGGGGDKRHLFDLNLPSVQPRLQPDLNPGITYKYKNVQTLNHSHAKCNVNQFIEQSWLMCIEFCIVAALGSLFR